MEDDEETMNRTKKGQEEDWQLLKQTLRSGGENPDNDGVSEFQDKVDDILEMREDLVTKHMKYIRKVALLLKQEGELITRVQGIDQSEEERYPIDKYVEKMRQIVQHNINIYTDLDQDLMKLKVLQNYKMKKV